MPRVSVLIPVFNAAPYVRDALASIRGQTFRDFEITAVDDGSSDGSSEILDAIAVDEIRMRVVRQAHSGVERTLMRAAAGATSEYLAVMDADDIAHPERFAAQVEFLDAHPEIAACGTHFNWTGDPVASGRVRYRAWLNGLTSPEELRRALFVECPIAHPSLMMRREAHDAAGGYRVLEGPEDYDLILRLALHGGAMANLPRELLQWRHHGDRLHTRSGRYSPGAFRAIKREYLFQFYPLAGRRFIQWGAGSVGKAWLREWETAKPEAVVDLHPRKIGREIHGVPVIPPEDLPGPGEAFIVAAVGMPGAREEIQGWLDERGYRELEDYVFLA